MTSNGRIKIGFLTIVWALPFMACQQQQNSYHKIEPAHIEHIEGSDLARITLTEKAAERLDIQTSVVREVVMADDATISQKVVPYASTIYDAQGHTWVYTNPEKLVYVRHEIIVDFIDGNNAVLLEGPPKGTSIVTVGVAELYGTEHEVGH